MPFCKVMAPASPAQGLRDCLSGYSHRAVHAEFGDALVSGFAEAKVEKAACGGDLS